MNEFKDFLLDYEMKEKEQASRFLEKVSKGKIERYPPLSRFIGPKEPLAQVNSIIPIWGVIPFYGSTVFPLAPVRDKKVFNDFYAEHGFTSKDIDRLIDFVKQTGRLQFVISQPPTRFEKLEFLRPLFEELRPPMGVDTLPQIIGPKKFQERLIEFDTLASFGLKQAIQTSKAVTWGIHEQFMKQVAYRYVLLESIGPQKLVNDINDSLVTDPFDAMKLLLAAGNLYAPAIDSLGGTSNYSLEGLTQEQNIVRKYHPSKRDRSIYEIGKFILDKVIYYPTTQDGCMDVIQRYQDHQLLKVSQALHEGVKEKKPDIIRNNTSELSRILDSVWKDANKVKRRGEYISCGVSAGICLIGELASGLPGVGILASLGFQVLERLTEEKLSEKAAKLITPDYLVTIYDFQKKLRE